MGVLALFSLLATLAVFAYVSRTEAGLTNRASMLILVIVGTAGVAIRFDFIVILTPLTLLALAWSPNWQSRLTFVGLVCLPILAGALGVLVFQCAYWGDWLPNTYRLKMEGFPLQERLGRGFATAGKTLPLVILAIASLWVVFTVETRTNVRRLCSLLFVVGLTPIAYSIWVGGDAWDNFLMLNRYVSVGVPALVALFFVAAGVYLRKNFVVHWARPASIPLLVASIFGMSLVTNPLGIRRSDLEINIAVLPITAALLWITIVWQRRAPQVGIRHIAVFLALSLVTIAVTSSTSAASWLTQGGQYTDDDQRETEIGLALQEVTTPEAVIAVQWAGAPAYYAQRPMIDVLGKSDRVIATGPPAVDPANGERVPFYPGHSKYDASYSVQQLAPDVVQSLPWDVDAAQMTAWGYVSMCSQDGIELYVLAASKAVIWDRLMDCA